MATRCGPTIQQTKVDEARELDYSKVERMVELIERDPRIRFALGLDPKMRINSKYAFAEWVRRSRVMKNPLNEPLSSADINYLMAEMIRVQDVISRTKGFATRTEFKTFMNKMVFLPQMQFARDLVRGDDIFMTTQIIKHRADQKRVSSSAMLEDLGRQFRAVVNVSMKEVDEVIEKHESALAQALDYQKILRDNPNIADAVRQEAAISVEDARQRLQSVLRGEVDDPALSRALRLQRAVVLALQGRYLHVDKATGKETVKRMRVVQKTTLPSGPEMAQGIESVTTTSPARESIEMAMRNALPDLDAKTAKGPTSGIIEQVGKYLDHFGTVASEGLEYERNNLIHELTRGEAMLSEADAVAIADKLLKFDKQDMYFPRMALSHMSRLQAIMNGLRTAADPRAYLREVLRNGDQIIFKGEGTPHVMERTKEIPQRDVSMNLFRVMSDYAGEVVNYWHDNYLASKMNDYVKGLWEVGKELKPEQYDEWVDYVRGVQDYLVQFAEISKNSPSGGKLEELSKIMIAARAAVTMGFWNTSTPLLNLGEGQALIWTRAGSEYMNMSGDRKRLFDEKVLDLIKDEYVEIVPEETFLMDYEGAERKLLRAVGDSDASRMLMVEKDATLLFLQRIRKATTNAAKKAIILQTKAENVNRTRAFRIGSVMEYEYIEGKIKPMLLSENANKILSDTDIIAMFGKENLNSIRRQLAGSSEMREQVWKRFARSRVIKAGYEFMYQTQWNYNQGARHFLEHAGPIPKMAMMFQHYPLSWIAAWQRTYTLMKSSFEAGGVRAMFERDPKSRALFARKGNLKNALKSGDMKQLTNLGYWTNNEMMFALSAGAVAALVTGLRYGTGIVLGQFWQHPATEVVQDTIRYVQNGFNGDEEKNKALFWGRGILNEFTGPFYSDFMDAVSLAALKVGIDDGDMPRWTADLLRGTLGFRPNELLLTQYGARRFGDAFDVMNESFLFGALSVAPKAARVATTIPRVGDEIYDLGVGKGYETLTGGHVGRTQDPGMKDFGAALLKAAGMRDEKSLEEYLERKLKKDVNQ